MIYNKDLDVFKYSCADGMKLKYHVKYYLKTLFKRCKYVYQRAKYGYCDLDSWNIDCHTAKLLSVMLRDLAENGTGWPGVERGVDTFEQWQQMLKTCADDLDFCITETYDDPVVDTKYQAMENLTDRSEMKMSAQSFLEHINNPKILDQEKYEIARKEWITAETKAWNDRIDAKNRALDFIKEWWFNLWD